ncbi:MAG: LD-carboxypeptidase [Deltaproteobacteria bacterium]|nr:LD-carboxypeptidase [Deltaproteobacteria bacterium]
MTRRIRTVAVAAPSGPAEPGALARGLAVLRELGCEVELIPPGEPEGFLAAPDGRRAARFLEAVSRGADLLMAARGGYGAARLMALLPPASPAGPGILMGFSDVTALLVSLCPRWGWGAVHGPNVTTLQRLDRASLEALAAFLEYPDRGLEFRGLEPLAPGRGRGLVLAGNLSVLCSLMGTSLEPDLAGRILVIEDTGEAPYRLDRLLRQLAGSKGFPALAGLAAGDLGEGAQDDAVRRTLVEICTAAGVPAASGLPVGHGASNRPLRLSANAFLDAAAGTLVTGLP